LSLAGCGSEDDRVLEETFERLHTVQPNTDISIQNHDGAVLVYGGNTNELQVYATKKAYSRMRLKEIAIDVSVQPTTVSINTKFPPQPRWALFDRSGTVDYTIVLPATATISQLRLVAGEVVVDGMRGPSVHASLGDGRMLAHNCFTKIDLALQRGNLTLSYDWWEHGTFSVHANIAKGTLGRFFPASPLSTLLPKRRMEESPMILITSRLNERRPRKSTCWSMAEGRQQLKCAADKRRHQDR
jgi:hypothetical protein